MPRDTGIEFEGLGSAAVAAPLLPAAEVAPATDEVLDVLVRARAAIEQPGSWGQCDRFNRITGQRCLHGAIEAVERYGHPAAIEALIEAVDTFPLDRYWADSPREIRAMMFNDSPNTTHADVLALFDRAIAARKAS